MKCPECGREIEIEDTEGILTSCSGCGSTLMVENHELVPAPELEGEDWGEHRGYR